MSPLPDQHVVHARELLARYAYSEALSEAEIALGGLERSAGSSLLQGEAYYLAGAAAYYMADYPLAQEYLNHAAESFNTHNVMERVAACQMMLAESRVRQVDVRHAKHMAQQLAEQSALEGWRHLHARALACLGTASWMEGETAQALDLLNQAIAIHQELDEPRYAYLARISLAVALLKAERSRESARVLEECLQYFHAQGDLLHAVHCLNNLAGIAFQTGDLERAREYLLQCTEFQTETHQRGDMVVSWYNLGLIEGKLGNPKLARKYLYRSYQVAQEVGDRIAEGMALLQLGIAALYEGRANDALNFANLARIPLNNAPAPQACFLAALLPVFHLACGNSELAQEQWSDLGQVNNPEAIDTLREALTLLTGPSHPMQPKLRDQELALASKWLAELP